MDSCTPLFDEIVAHGNRGHHHGWLRYNSDIITADGITIGVYAGNSTYCSTRPPLCEHKLPGMDQGGPIIQANDVPCDYPGPYDHVEVHTDNPELLEMMGLEYDGNRHSLCMPAEFVRDFLIIHEGEYSAASEAENLLARITRPGV